MDGQFTFFYPIIEESQLDFDGRPHVKEVFLEGHILHQGRLMCKESMEVIMSKTKAKKKKILPKRTISKLCSTCLEEYRNHPDSAYYRYVNGAPARVTVIEKNVAEMRF